MTPRKSTNRLRNPARSSARPRKTRTHGPRASDQQRALDRARGGVARPSRGRPIGRAHANRLTVPHPSLRSHPANR